MAGAESTASELPSCTISAASSTSDAALNAADEDGAGMWLANGLLGYAVTLLWEFCAKLDEPSVTVGGTRGIEEGSKGVEAGSDEEAAPSVGVFASGAAL